MEKKSKGTRKVHFDQEPGRDVLKGFAGQFGSCLYMLSCICLDIGAHAWADITVLQLNFSTQTKQQEFELSIINQLELCFYLFYLFYNYIQFYFIQFYFIYFYKIKYLIYHLYYMHLHMLYLL